MKKCILQICAGNPYFNFLFCKFRSKIFHQEHFLNGLINQSLKYGMSPIKLSLLKYYHFNFHQPPLLWYTIYEISVKAHNLFLRPEIQGNLPSASTFLGCGRERGGVGMTGFGTFMQHAMTLRRWVTYLPCPECSVQMPWEGEAGWSRALDRAGGGGQARVTSCGDL